MFTDAPLFAETEYHRHQLLADAEQHRLSRVARAGRRALRAARAAARPPEPAAVDPRTGADPPPDVAAVGLQAGSGAGDDTLDRRCAVPR
jgi:hypothetical protein